MTEIDYNALLYYLSLSGKGSWIQFKNSINNINYSDEELNHNSVRMMFSRLGHIEFDFNKGSGNIWSVCYPCISIIPETNIGILAGYRIKEFLKKLEELCSRKNIEYKVEKNFGAPDLITIDFKNENNINNFENYNELNIKIVQNFPSKILYLHSNIEEIVNNLELAPDFSHPENYNLRYFLANKHDFDDNSTKEDFEQGLYKQEIYGVSKFFLKIKKEWYKVDKRLGIFIHYYILNVKNLIKFENNSLKIIKYIYFPELIDRAITMFSGYNPKVTKEYRIYDNINENFAEILTKKLGQELEK